ncbi:MAG: sugar ABC transporter permease [Roseiarcus sp.]
MTSAARYRHEVEVSARAVLGRFVAPPAIWFALPAFLFVGVFFVAPLILNVPLSFSNWTTYRTAIVWNGFANFNLLYGQGYLINAIWVTIAYSVIAMLVQNVVSLSLAYALRESTLLNGFFRSLFFLPVLVSPLAVGYIWRGILDPAGPLDSFISILCRAGSITPGSGTQRRRCRRSRSWTPGSGSA